MTQSATPALTISSKSSGDFTLSVQLDEKDGAPYFLITNDKTKEQMLLPTDMLDSFIGSFEGNAYLLHEMKEAQSNILRKINHPLKRFDDLGDTMGKALTKSDKNPKSFSILCEKEDERGTPILDWTYNLDTLKETDNNFGTGSNNVPNITTQISGRQVRQPSRNPNIKNVSGLAPRSGWRLTFRGVKDNITLGFAPWDDVEAIDDLVNKMRTPDPLHVALTLISPNESMKLKNRSRIYKELIEDLDSLEKAPVNRRTITFPTKSPLPKNVATSGLQSSKVLINTKTKKPSLLKRLFFSFSSEKK